MPARTFVSARISGWECDSPHPTAMVRQSLGQAGEIESGTAVILEAEGIRSEPFGADVLACLPKLPWRMSEPDIAARRDYRATRIFSIDPITAKVGMPWGAVLVMGPGGGAELVMQRGCWCTHTYSKSVCSTTPSWGLEGGGLLVC